MKRTTGWALAAAALALVVAWALRAGQSSQGGAPEPGRTERALRAKPVVVQPVSKQDLQVSLEYPGELWAEAAELAATRTGRLVEVEVRLGQHFAEGDTLARLDATELQRQVEQAQAQVAAARAQVAQLKAEAAASRTELQRAEALVHEQVLPIQQLDSLRAQQGVFEARQAAASAARAEAAAQLELLRYQLAQSSLRAPFGGAVAERYLDPGGLVQPGTPVLRLVKSGPLRVRFRVPERDVLYVRPGQSLSVATQATEEKLASGEVAFVSAEVSRSDRMLAVEGVLRGEEERLRAGMHATVRVTLRELEDVLVVPASALVERARVGAGEARDGDEAWGVFVVLGDKEAGEVARLQPLQVLGRAGELVAVQGLESSAQIVVQGQGTLSDGDPVRAQRKAASPAEGE